jgi:single-stranded-DNA-specific exonuclease
LEQLEPCGNGNQAPLLASYGLPVVNSRVVGAERRHLKLTVRDPESGEIFDAIAFRLGEWFERHGPKVDLAYTLEVSDYGGEHRLQLNVKDLRPAA